MAEYIQGQIYFGMIEDEELISCRKPMGHIKEKEFLDNASQSSFCLNMRERQSCNNNLIILKMKGEIRNKLEWGCPNGTKYPPRQPIPNRRILPNRAHVYRRTDRVIPVYPPNLVAGGIINRYKFFIFITRGSSRYHKEIHPRQVQH